MGLRYTEKVAYTVEEFVKLDLSTWGRPDKCPAKHVNEAPEKPRRSVYDRILDNTIED